MKLELLGENHPYTGFSYNNIGVTQHQLGAYTSALDSHHRALEIWRERLRENHRHKAVSYSNIGTLHSDLGDYISAFQSHREHLKQE